MLRLMYARHFGLQHEPFSIAPDPRFLFMSERHREALAHLLYGLQSGGGFVLLTGEIGAGKTTVCRAFLEQVPAHCHVAYIFNPKLTAAELLQSVCDELGVAVAGSGFKAQVDALNAYLLRTHAAGENNVLVIDEAQGLSGEVLEQLRLLTNLETHERMLLQIILIGQPELRDMLARPELEQLAQRVIARYHLAPLDEADTSRYMRHRLAVAGCTGVMPFERSARSRVYRLTGGVPRRINVLCDRALLGAYVGGSARVSQRIVDQAAREVFDLPRLRSPQAMTWASMGAVGALALASMFWWGRGPASTARAASAPVAAALSAASAASVSVSASVSAGTNEVAATAAIASAALVSQAAQPTWQAPAQPWPEGTAWRALARLWGVELATGEPCAVARAQQLQCFHSSSINLAAVRQLARPGIVTLHDANGAASSALLIGLGEERAVLRTDVSTQTLSLAAFGTAWRGDFGTYWRSPVGETTVAQQLERIAASAGAPTGGPVEPAAATRIQAFQRAQGLVADGVPGAMTLMQLNRALGVDEPRLSR